MGTRAELFGPFAACALRKISALIANQEEIA
jgi:hypothetical protein